MGDAVSPLQQAVLAAFSRDTKCRDQNGCCQSQDTGECRESGNRTREVGNVLQMLMRRVSLVFVRSGGFLGFKLAVNSAGRLWSKLSRDLGIRRCWPPSNSKRSLEGFSPLRQQLLSRRTKGEGGNLVGDDLCTTNGATLQDSQARLADAREKGRGVDLWGSMAQCTYAKRPAAKKVGVKEYSTIQDVSPEIRRRRRRRRRRKRRKNMVERCIE